MPKTYVTKKCLDCDKIVKYGIRCRSCAAKASHPKTKPFIQFCPGCGRKNESKHGFHGQRGLCRKCASPLVGLKRRRRVALVCPQCQKTFETEPNIAKKNDKTFCSKKCYDEWKSDNLTGDKVHNWKGGTISYYGPNWRSQRKKTRERANHKCEYCNKSQGRQLDVHHIKPFRSFNYIKGENDNHLLANDLSNLIALCFNCHRRVEAGRIIIKSRSNIYIKPECQLAFYKC